jgi:hypothetical protein
VQTPAARQIARCTESCTSDAFAAREPFDDDIIVVRRVSRSVSGRGLLPHVIQPRSRCASCRDRHRVTALWGLPRGVLPADSGPSAIGLITLDLKRTRFLVYGSVLPWTNAIHHAAYLARAGESPRGLFARVLRDQVNDMLNMRKRWSDHTLIWAGDFNQTLSGPNYGGSKQGRQLLSDALEELDLVAWNQGSSHAKPAMHAIDLICNPADRTLPRRVEHLKPELDGRVLSDHAGYLVEI